MVRGLLLVLVGCGRLSFEPLEDASDARDAAAPDAEVIAPDAIRFLRAGGNATCALLGSGDVWCWGPAPYHAKASVAQLGVPDRIVAPEPFVDLVVGDAGACGRTASGRYDCWGPNQNGALGLGMNGIITTPTRVADTDIVQMTLGFSVACIRRTNGFVACAGAAAQLGDGSASDRNTFGDVPGLSNVLDVVAGDQHACALRSDGSVVCWGYNGNGQLGTGNSVDSPTPIEGPMGPYTALRAGDQYTCGLRSNAIDCWGRNTSGELGTGATSVNERSAVTVTTVTGFDDVVTGAIHVCVLLADRTLRCWGDNANGEMGVGNQVTPQLAAVAPQVTDVIAMTSRTSVHTCALTATREAYCWGANDKGQCGNDAMVPATSPLPVLGLP